VLDVDRITYIGCMDTDLRSPKSLAVDQSCCHRRCTDAIAAGITRQRLALIKDGSA